jgi:hypothetical protein
VGRGDASNLDVALDGRIPHGAAVVVVHAAGEVRARAGWLGGPYHQLRCEAPAAVAAGDAIEVLVAPGERLPGTVLDPDAPRHGPSNDLLVRLTRLARGEDPAAPPAAG